MDKYDKVIEAFGKRVKKLRVEHGYSQEAFAQEAGIDRSYYGRIERGDANLTLRNIAAIADVLDLSIPELFMEPVKPGKR
jgi:transcriptional regulator with XRE-family HTH domain